MSQSMPHRNWTAAFFYVYANSTRHTKTLRLRPDFLMLVMLVRISFRANANVEICGTKDPEYPAYYNA